MNDRAARFDRLAGMIASGNVIRQKWTDGHDRACLLAALSPEVGESHFSAACPAWLLPPWFAELVPAMDDNGSGDAWPGFVSRFADVVRHASEVLTADGWNRAEYRVRALAVREAMQHTDNARVLAACKTVVALCESVVAGTNPSAEAWSAAYSAAGSAESAAWSAESAAYYAAASAAESAAYSAAGSAAASTAWSAESAAESAAYSAAAWDRMNTAILDALELEIRASENRTQG